MMTIYFGLFFAFVGAFAFCLGKHAEQCEKAQERKEMQRTAARFEVQQ